MFLFPSARVVIKIPVLFGRDPSSASCASSASGFPWATSASRYVLVHVDSGALPGWLEASSARVHVSREMGLGTTL
jgi:hypothetical protein